MIINYSLHGYIRICLLHLGTFFYSLFLFYPLGWQQVCVHYPKNNIFTPIIDFGSLCKYVIFFMVMLDFLYHAFLWEI
jgi:hypothetical protein